MCGVCHPGGGPVEYDRNGNRYDKFAADPKNGIVPGGTNNFDGDYFKSRWAQSGVLEADCLLCHLKDYNYKKRKEQIMAFNYRWAATAGAEFGKIRGKVINGEVPYVIYDVSKFQKDGKVLLSLVKEVPNENCIFCHRESDWKKRGQSYTARTDVHIRAGIRCVDCHPAGRNAVDTRIKGREEHQFGKGDDPGGFVRNDLDNTMRRCEDCHKKGILNAPVIKHPGFPPIHFKKLACQTCHIPWRQVRAALIQDASVFNTSPRIWPPPKRIWSFYGPDMKPWNYYGEAHGYPEGVQPFFKFRPILGWYKGKIYPLNRVYTRWVGIKTDGKPGIDQPHMKDIFMMWKKHMDDPDKNFPQLKKIKDDNRDGFPEVNRPEEVKALLASVSIMLKGNGMPLQGKTVVFVDGDRYTTNGVDWKTIPKKPYEYSPYGSVFKFDHDICPGKNALGAQGCTDCHSSKSDFFFRKVMVRPFDKDGKPVTESNAHFLDYSPTALSLMAFQQGTLKSLGYWALFILVVLLMLHYVVYGPKRAEPGDPVETVSRFRTWERIIHYSLLVLFTMQAITGLFTFSIHSLSSDAIGRFNTVHHYVGYLFLINIVMVFGIWVRDAFFEKFDWEWLTKVGGYLGYKGELPAARFNAGQKLYLWLVFFLGLFLAITGLIDIFSSDGSLRLAMHSLHAIAAFILIMMVMVHVYLGVLANPGTLRGIFEGKVSKSWARKHHPLWKTEE